MAYGELGKKVVSEQYFILSVINTVSSVQKFRYKAIRDIKNSRV
jgi:hypothetical protein